MFDKSSVIVKTWAKLVEDGKYTLDQVPKLFNLREEVTVILQEKEM